MPAGVKPEQVAFYVNVLKKASETPEWTAFLQTNALNGVFLTGDALKNYIANDEAMARAIYKDSGWLIK
jgi:tripartite-type tricarboxylate transporter receptor subunit TctC